MSRAWWCIGVAGQIVVGGIVALFVFLAFLPFFASLPSEFVDVPKDRAPAYLEGRWQGVDVPQGIEKVSGKVYSQIDCHAGWYKLTLSPTDAKELQDAIHARLEKSARLGRGIEFIEGVHRSVTGPAPTDTNLGNSPRWWHPPSNSFRVTERMRWYSGGTTYADAVYSEFDDSTNSLWIFDEGQQHGQYWKRGSVPAGRQFVLGSNSESRPTQP